MNTYLVTGGAGFIGSNIVRELVRKGHNVRIFDDFSTGRIENLHGLIDSIQIVRGSIRNLDEISNAMTGVDYVLHQAAQASVVRSLEDPLGCHATNGTGTLNVFYAARQAGVKRVVYASSSSVYGNTEVLPKVESMPADPISPYAAAKYCGELYGAIFSNAYDLPVVSLRYFNVFGPRQDPASHYAAVIPKFIVAMLKGDRPTILGDGSQTRDFCHVSNVVHANLLACEAQNAAGKVFNIACGERLTLLELVNRINQVLGTKIEPILGDWRAGDVRHSHADITAAEAILGYTIKLPLDDALRDTVNWYTNNTR
ncbi:MAG: SDR family oxidoreductase [Myxococcales bacterium]|nr:SDR family oxidoreductase [Myxococcales bacterium]